MTELKADDVAGRLEKLLALREKAELATTQPFQPDGRSWSIAEWCGDEEDLVANSMSFNVAEFFSAASNAHSLYGQAIALIRSLEADKRSQAARIEKLEGALKPFAEAMAWEETEGNFGVQFMPDAPAERFRDEVGLRFVAWWGKDWELESADTFCTFGDLRNARAALERT